MMVFLPKSGQWGNVVDVEDQLHIDIEIMAPGRTYRAMVAIDQMIPAPFVNSQKEHGEAAACTLIEAWG